MAAIRLPNSYYSKPLIVILGCTGTGKSKLAIQLAKKFHGEIINADAMQVYKGLDIITNKVTPEEQKEVQHHLLGFLNPPSKLFVGQYKNLALQAIKEVMDREKLPIIVGGTYYYVESILYDFVLGKPSADAEGKDFGDELTKGENPRKKLKLEEYEEKLAELKKLDNEKLYEKLRKVDPETAEKTHPNCRRKVLRGIMVHHQFGETLSSILKRQRSQPGGCSTGGPLKFFNSVILLLQCELDVLRERLNTRVDDMMSRGLVNEILEFYRNCNQEDLLAEKGEKQGVYQSIGVKEFYKFLTLDEDKRETEEGKKFLKEGEELLKIATRQYAKRQSRWISSRFLNNSQRQIPLMYGLNVTDLSKWDENVYKIAEDVVESHLSGKKPSAEPLVLENKKVIIDRLYPCECGVILLGKTQHESHLNSKSHERRLRRKKKLEENETKTQVIL